MLVGSEGGITSYGLIRFNSFTGYGLSKIISATITLTASGSNLSLNETFSLQRIENAGWDENVSYNTVNSFDCASPNERTSLTIKSNGSCGADDDVKEDVVGIIMGEYANYGYRLSYSGGFINFASSETDVAGSRPVITIEYEMESFANDTYYINSKGYYTFMSTGDTGYYPSTEKYNVDPLSENSGIMWEITSVGTNDAHCIIRPVGYASYALSDPNNEEGKPIFESLSPTATATASSRFKWLIFEYEEGIYYIKNKATGMILRCGGIGGDSIYVTPAQNVDNCKWRIMTEDEYNPRMFGELDPIKLELEESYNLSDIELPIAGTTFAEESEPYLISASIGCLDISADYSTITARSYGVARFTMGFRDNTSQISVYFLIPEYDGTYFIKNVASDLCLDVEAGGDKAMQQNYDQNSPPVWQIEMQTDGYYTIKDVESGRFLKVSGDSSAENQVVKVQSSAAMSAGYRFKIFTTADGFYKIVPKTNTNLTLAISATNTSEGNVIRQITYTANDDYKDEWRVIPNIYGTQDFRQLDESEYTEINCHGYAMMRNDKPDDWLPATHMTVSGYFASNSDYEQYTDIVALSTKQEFESWLRNVYGTDYYDYEGVITNNFDYTPLMHNQDRVVLRIGLGLVNKENNFDYHFWYQTYDGRWANKHGFEEDSEPELLNYNVTPCTENTDGWAIGDAYPNFYDSPIHSFIITIPESEVE